MVKYKAKVVKVYVDEGPAGEVVESQLVLDVGGRVVEAFNLSRVLPRDGSTVKVCLSMLPHDVVKVNIPEKFIRQLTRVPYGSLVRLRRTSSGHCWNGEEALDNVRLRDSARSELAISKR